jgi:RNA polymerase sigma-70 factor (ECF subfamily)
MGAPDQPESAGMADVPALCAAAAGGDADAVARLLALHHGRFEGFARQKIGREWAARIDADDVLQEAYIDVFRGLPGFSPQGEDSFYHWVTRIIEHKFVDRVRALSRQKRDVAREAGVAGAFGANADSILERIVPDWATASRTMRKGDAVAALLSCVAKLPEDHRLVVQRVYLQGHTFADVAKETGRSEDAVRRLAGRVLEGLAREFGDISKYLSRVP